MKLIVDAKVLRAALKPLGKVVPASNVKESLRCVMIRADIATVAMETSDLDVSIRTETPAGIPEPGMALLPYRALVAGLKGAKGPVTIESAGMPQGAAAGHGSEVFRASHAGGSVELLGHWPSEFPVLSYGAGKRGISIAPDDFRALADVRVAASIDAGRFALNGVLLRVRYDSELERDPGRIRVAATDGKRLHLVDRIVPPGHAQFEAVVPTLAMDVLADTTDPVEIIDGDGLIVFRSGRRLSVQARKVDGQFPPYEVVIPSDDALTHEARIDAGALATAMDGAKAFLAQTKEPRTVAFSFRPGFLDLSTQVTGLGRWHAEIPVSYDGEPIRIGLNPWYISDATPPSRGVTFRFGEPDGPAVVRQERDAFALVMPIDLKEEKEVMEAA